MRVRRSLFLSNANQVCRRANDNVLQMSGLRTSMEGKLTSARSLCKPARPGLGILVLLFILFMPSFLSAECEGQTVAQKSSFSLVVYVCVWRRPLLTDFVLSHYHRVKQSLLGEGIHLHMFVVGSENASTIALAQRYSAAFAIHPNSPLGAKHDKGLQSMREHFINELEQKRITSLPNAVGVFGSDDMVNPAFFQSVKDLMSSDASPRSHMVGLRDIFFYDLKSRRLVYTKGYRSFHTKISGTLGCGRVYSWSLLDMLDWHLWDMDREHGLDQSATRNVMKKIPMVDEVSIALIGREVGIIAIDIKSDGYKAGTNIWRFDEVIEAVGRNGRFHDFEYETEEGILRQAFGADTAQKLDTLRAEMANVKSE